MLLTSLVWFVFGLLFGEILDYILCKEFSIKKEDLKNMNKVDSYKIFGILYTNYKVLFYGYVFDMVILIVSIIFFIDSCIVMLFVN